MYEYRPPTVAERTGAIALQVVGFAFFLAVFWLAKKHTPLWFLPGALLTFPVLRLTGGPLARQMKLYDYRSEFAFVYKPKEGELELHMGGSYDYPRLWRKAGSGAGARRLLLASALETLASVARDVEAGTLPATTRVSAVSYFFSDATAQRFGFRPEPVTPAEEGMFMLSVGDIVPMYWLLTNSLKWPQLTKLKRYATTAGELVQHRPELEKLVERLSH